ncbi:DUF6685 family protein [Pseudomonas aeruginosa]|uniref:DUF6685 family protein n=1 Tax=Pseudomonas aeruginosa TaxID=287 RepID=UPI0028933685|nr:DUF6685 family protein [Pseudomonas aeruginosa]
MSSNSRSNSTFTGRLSALANRLRLGAARSDGRELRERAAALELPFQPLRRPEPSVWWQAGPPLHTLVDLPRGALSGPVQEDKAEAHAVLKRLVRVSHSTLESVDLKTIEGVCSREILVQAPCPRLEDLATAEVCRGVRIISYKDFVKALSLALPRFTNGDSIRLRQAAWHGERLFWAGERQACAFAAAIVYARRRELELKLPAHLERYELEPGALDELEQRYHMLRIPTEAWSEPTFMSLLLDTGLPCARLALFTPETPECLLLPRNDERADALGEGLRAAGAADVVKYLKQL